AGRLPPAAGPATETTAAPGTTAAASAVDLGAAAPAAAASAPAPVSPDTAPAPVDAGAPTPTPAPRPPARTERMARAAAREARAGDELSLEPSALTGRGADMVSASEPGPAPVASFEATLVIRIWAVSSVARARIHALSGRAPTMRMTSRLSSRSSSRRPRLRT